MNFYSSIKASRESYVDTLSRLYEYSTAAFEKKPFLNLVGADTHYTYGQFKKRTDAMSKILGQYGIGAGDRVAVLSASTPNWSVAMFSSVAFGRIFVPILPDSSQSEVTNILNHSETKAIFVSKRLYPNISQECREKLTLIIDIETLEIVKERDDAFTIDGKVTWTTDLKGLGKEGDGKVKSQGVPQTPGYIKLSVEAAPWAGPNGGGWEKDMPEEDEARIDWVRVWQKP